jgi:hypothetical protein
MGRSRLSGVVLAICGAIASLSLAILVARLFRTFGEPSATEAVTYGDVRRWIFKELLHVDIAAYWSSPMLDILLLWITAFLSLNVFTFQNDGLTVWGHILENHGKIRYPAGTRRVFGATWKTIIVLVFAPGLLLYFALRTAVSPQRQFTALDVTVAPLEVLGYIKYVGMATALIFVAAFAASGGSPTKLFGGAS